MYSASSSFAANGPHQPFVLKTAYWLPKVAGLIQKVSALKNLSGTFLYLPSFYVAKAGLGLGGTSLGMLNQKGENHVEET